MMPAAHQSPDLRHQYDSWHQPLARNDALETPWHRMLVERLSGLSLSPSTRVLEVACGRGELATWMADATPARIWAADFSITALAKARASGELSGPGPEWLAADISKLPFADGIFDLVCSCETIEHVPSPKDAIRELHRVLRPDGLLLLSTPNYLNASGLYRLYLRLAGRRYSEAGQPLNHPLLLPTTCWWLRRAGFDLLLVDGEGHYFPLWPGRPALHARWLDALRPLTKWIAVQTFIVACRI